MKMPLNSSENMLKDPPLPKRVVTRVPRELMDKAIAEVERKEMKEADDYRARTGKEIPPHYWTPS